MIVVKEIEFTFNKDGEDYFPDYVEGGNVKFRLIEGEVIKDSRSYAVFESISSNVQLYGIVDWLKYFDYQ